MRCLTLLFIFLSIHYSASLFAQCPPPGFPTPGDNCGSPIMCENLDGYCNTINNNNKAKAFPCCPGNTLNNDEWFGFFAGTTTITIDITPSNCMPGSNGDLGMQAAIYATCPPANPSNQWCTDNLMDTQCSCTQNTFTLTSNNFVVGQIYWIVLDGCSGSVCDYAVDVMAGQSTPFPPDAPGAVTGPSPICQGTSGDYSLPLVNGVCNYTWTIVPANAGTVTGSSNSINVTWAADYSGNADLCVQVSNGYFQGGTSCFPVDVLPKPTATLSFSDVTCNGANNGSATVMVIGAANPVSYSWSNGATTQSLNNLISGLYTVSITDGNNCFVESSVSINEPVILLANASATDLTDYGANDGTATTAPTGGTPAYAYQWSNGGSSQTITGLAPGTYTVTVTDVQSCTVVQTVYVSAFNCMLLASITTSNVLCFGEANGQATISMSGGASPYTYSWNNGATSQTINNLAAGTYTVTVADIGACDLIQSVNIVEPALLMANVVNIQNVHCTQDTTGTATIAGTGGTGPYTYEWPGGKKENLGVGSYTVTVTDAQGCKASVSFNIVTTDIQAPVIACPFDIKICGANIINYPLAIALDNCGLIGAPIVISGPPSGSVFMEGTTTIVYQASDGTGNTATCSFTVLVQELPAILIDTVIHDMNGQGVGGIFISPTGNGNYTYKWNKNGQPFALTEDLIGLVAGFYSLTITDENGCTASFPPIIISNTSGLHEPNKTGSVKLWPNPAESAIQLEIIDLDIIAAQIVDMRGSLIKTIHPAELSNKIEISSMPVGMYCMKLSCENGQVLSIKFEKMGQ